MVAVLYEKCRRSSVPVANLFVSEQGDSVSFIDSPLRIVGLLQPFVDCHFIDYP